MDIFSVSAIAVIGTILAVTIKSVKPEMSILVSVATGVVILFLCFDFLSDIIKSFNEIINKSGVNSDYFQVVLKVCTIAYISQYASELCKDAGESAIATKAELAGKVFIVILSMPVISGFLNAISTLLDRI